jgi:hypothetical protein
VAGEVLHVGPLAGVLPHLQSEHHNM